MNLKHISPQVSGPILAALVLALSFFVYSTLNTNSQSDCFVPKLEQPTAASRAGFSPEYQVPDKYWIVVEILPDMDGRTPPNKFYVASPGEIFDNKARFACVSEDAALKKAVEMNENQNR